MASAKIVKADGTEVGSVELSDAVFNVDAHPALVHDVVVALQGAQRQGNAETKVRHQVRGGGSKPYRQKGTGSARHGSLREPQMRGGGVVFGPHKRSYKKKVPLSFRRKALCSVLSDRVRTDALCVLESLDCAEPKTKPFADMVKALSPDGKKTLFITAEANRNALLSSRNLPRVSLCTAGDLNALEVLLAARVVVEQAAVAKLEERLQ